jgi:hypothetical protein
MEIIQAAAGVSFAHFLAALAVPADALGAYLQRRAEQNAPEAAA